MSYRNALHTYTGDTWCGSTFYYCYVRHDEIFKCEGCEKVFQDKDFIYCGGDVPSPTYMLCGSCWASNDDFDIESKHWACWKLTYNDTAQ